MPPRAVDISFLSPQTCLCVKGVWHGSKFNYLDQFTSQFEPLTQIISLNLSLKNNHRQCLNIITLYIWWKKPESETHIWNRMENHNLPLQMFTYHSVAEAKWSWLRIPLRASALSDAFDSVEFRLKIHRCHLLSANASPSSLLWFRSTSIFEFDRWVLVKANEEKIDDKKIESLQC